VPIVQLCLGGPVVSDTEARRKIANAALAAPTALEKFSVRHVHNLLADPARLYGARERAILDQESSFKAFAEIASWPGYAPTPLVLLPGLAAKLGFNSVSYKDEGKRFTLSSFKALGGAYALLRLLQKHLRDEHGLGEISARALVDSRNLDPQIREIIGKIVFVAATDGNHGRSVAWGAEMFGARSLIYLHEGVSAAREAEIARYGASIRRVPGDYDDSVRLCAADSAQNGWLLVADTSSEENAATPILVMQGYALIGEEILNELSGDRLPTHVFVPAGVGGLAAALAGHFWERLGRLRPRLVAVEPLAADCVFQTVAAGKPMRAAGKLATFMACLAAGKVSAVAWTLLKHGADDVLALPDEAAIAAMRVLAEGFAGDCPLVAGESGSAAFAGLVAAALDPVVRTEIGLGPLSRVLLIGSEGATDRETYRRVVGRPAEAVAEACDRFTRNHGQVRSFPTPAVTSAHARSALRHRKSAVLEAERLLIPASHGRAVELRAGEHLMVVNLHGTQVVDTWAFDPGDLRHYMAMDVSRRHMLKLRPKVGDTLFTNQRQPILTLVEDTSPGIHDTLFTCCDIHLYRMLGVIGYHRNCADNLRESMQALGLALNWVPAPLNLFMNIPVRKNLYLTVEPAISRPGDYVTLRAENDCIVALSACPQDMMSINGGTGLPADVEVNVIR
jgi:diaminopropionate ammonia-lyase